LSRSPFGAKRSSESSMSLPFQRFLLIRHAQETVETVPEFGGANSHRAKATVLMRSLGRFVSTRAQAAIQITIADGPNFVKKQAVTDLLQREHGGCTEGNSGHHLVRPRRSLIFFVNSSTVSFLITSVGTNNCLLAGMPDLSSANHFVIN
jgi:hypothetical protein